MALELVLSGWMTSRVLVMKRLSSTVNTAISESMTALTMRMLVLCAPQVCTKFTNFEFSVPILKISVNIGLLLMKPADEAQHSLSSILCIYNNNEIYFSLWLEIRNLYNVKVLYSMGANSSTCIY